jgi:hypothetical protein
MANGGGLFFIIYLILGLYLLNAGLGFVKMPAAILGIEKWIFVACAILLFFGAIKFLTSRRPNVR